MGEVVSILDGSLPPLSENHVESKEYTKEARVYLLGRWYKLTIEVDPEVKECGFCHMPIFGNEGTYHLYDGRERCEGKSPTGFHEVA